MVFFNKKSNIPSNDYFGVSIKVIEGKDLPDANMSSLVRVQVGDQKKHTRIVKSSSRPYYDDYFVFEVQSDFESFMGTMITISILQKRKRRFKKKLVGCIKFDVGIIWFQQDQELEEWFPLTRPLDFTAQVRGYVKCFIRIGAPESYKKPSDIHGMDLTNGKRARYRVKVYKCVGLKYERKHKINAPEVIVRVLYAGKKGETTKRKLREEVEWNEQIIFMAMSPPLFHKLTVELIIGKDITVYKTFHFSDFLKFVKGGNQNIFGPNFVHFYKNDFLYTGSLYMAIECENVNQYREPDKLHIFTTLPTEKYKSKIVKNFLCFGLLFNAILNEKKCEGCDIHLDMNFGFPPDYEETTHHPETDKLLTVKGNSDFCFLQINEQKPCVFVSSGWPDYTYRLKNSNMINNTTKNLRDAINQVEKMIAKGDTVIAKDIIKTALIVFERECQEVSIRLESGFSDLDRGKVKYLYKYLCFTVSELSSSCIIESRLEVILKKSISLIHAVEALSAYIQEALPSIVISLKQGKTVIGWNKLEPRHYLYAKKDLKRGRDCGKVTSIYMKSGNKQVLGRVDIWLWLGLWEDTASCLSSLPPGCEDLLTISVLPSFITYNKFESYTIYCRIHSGFIEDPKMFDSPCDTFVRVICSNKSQETKVKKTSLAPIWKETLILSDVRLYTTHLYNIDNPPLLSVEFWNKAADPPTVIGVELVKPIYRDWMKDISGNLQLYWLPIKNRARILCAFAISRSDIISDDPLNLKKLSLLESKFSEIATSPFNLEVIFWGIRPVESVILNQSINQVKAIIQCSTTELVSSHSFRTMPNDPINFKRNLNRAQLQLPKVNYFSPPLFLKIVAIPDNTSIGCAIEKNVYRYQCKLPSEYLLQPLYSDYKSCAAREKRKRSSKRQPVSHQKKHLNHNMGSSSSDETVDEKHNKVSFLPFKEPSFPSLPTHFSPHHSKHSRATGTHKVKKPVKPVTKAHTMTDDDEEYDWWFGYYSGDIKIYTNELEKQAEFNGFTDLLETFLVKEQTTGSKKKGLKLETIKVKAILRLYKSPSDLIEGFDSTKGILANYTKLEEVKLLVRVYCIRAHNLEPKDSNGFSDPYIEIATSCNRVSDRTNFITKQLNPTFGRCLEMSVTLPAESNLTIKVMDYDYFSSSDLIGETVIDIENRFYSQHRATCGLSKHYSLTGYVPWRDVENPTLILEKLCIKNNIPIPQYSENSVRVGSKDFTMATKEDDGQISHDRNEVLALMVLNKWQEIPIVGRPLVPHHVETRPLYVKSRPGIETGRLELWVDLFDESIEDIPPPVDIQPRQPENFELRIAILNAAGVPLMDDSFLVGKRSTDMFIKGWLWDSDDAQKTDVHWTSLDGTGNFNWRFIFKFPYLKQEKRIVAYRKDRFSFGTSESKVPPVVHLQVWDCDFFSPDDFIGAMELDLCNMPPGSMTLRSCKPSKFISPDKTYDLFKVKHLRGWWPFFQMSGNIEQKPAGFLEAEFHMLTSEEAIRNPAGMGRNSPNALPDPLRPSIRIKFWLAPIRAMIYVMFQVHRGTVAMCVIIVAVIFFVIVALYSIPVFVVKKIIGA